MDISDTPVATTRHDGWTPARKAQFLDHLAQDGNVLAACARVGLSREAAYRLRRRDPLFARAWAAAQALAREASAQVLASRAIDGIEEDVWYRGEVVGTRRRYDNRLLLAHVARLDKLVEADRRAEEDAGRFDELLARVAGVAVPDELAGGDADLPPTRHAHVKRACDAADREASRAVMELEDARQEAGEGTYVANDDPEWDALEAEAAAAWEEAYAGALVEWDAWFDEACATVDRLLTQPSTASGFETGTLSTLSTSSPARESAGEAGQPVPA